MKYPDGQIIMHHEPNRVHGIESITYEWQGGPLARVSNIWPDLPQVKPGAWITIGPYRCRVIDDMLSECTYIVSRESSFRSWLRYQCVHRSYRLNLIYRRTIITLAIWRLAQFNQGAYPTWRDITLVKRLQDWRTRGRAS